jgi:hypothetical protein
MLEVPPMALTSAEAAARLVVGRARWTSEQRRQNPGSISKGKADGQQGDTLARRTDDLVKENLRADRTERPAGWTRVPGSAGLRGKRASNAAGRDVQAHHGLQEGRVKKSTVSDQASKGVEGVALGLTKYRAPMAVVERAMMYMTQAPAMRTRMGT